MSSIPAASFFSSQNATTVRRSGSSSRPVNVSSSVRSTSAHQEPLRDGAIRNRENLVVSNREIRQLFDSMKEMGEIMKRQNAKLESMAAKLEDTSKEVSELKEQLKTRHQCDRQTSETDDVRRGPVPKELKGDVHLLHNQQGMENQFHGSEGIDSPHNAAVRSFLCLELGKENSGHRKSTIMRAVSRYYETKRQQYLDSLPDRRHVAQKRQAEKKLTSRRRRLFIKRMKVASGNEKQALQLLDPSFMSDEEDGEDLAGTWIVRSPPWRSPRLSSMLHKLQEKIDGQPSSHPQNSRVQGAPCARPPPPSSPAWAVCADDTDSRERIHERSTSPLSTTPPHPQSSQSPSEYGSGDENDENLDTSFPESPVRVSRRRRRVQALHD